ncbi:hypothetical protein C6353_26685 [Bacillus toyonensis]|nr:hypothetical protein C6353_26685 [Bacillus toyonensis]
MINKPVIISNGKPIPLDTYVFRQFYYIIIFIIYSIKKRHPKVSSFDLNHFNFNNMYWTPIPILFYHVKLFCSLRGYHHIAIYLKVLTTHSCYKYYSAKINKKR